MKGLEIVKVVKYKYSFLGNTLNKLFNLKIKKRYYIIKQGATRYKVQYYYDKNIFIPKIVARTLKEAENLLVIYTKYKSAKKEVYKNFIITPLVNIDQEIKYYILDTKLFLLKENVLYNNYLNCYKFNEELKGYDTIEEAKEIIDKR